MAISVVMPALEMAQETGKLVAWLKKEGDTVSKGEPLIEIETDKAVLEVEAAADGILAGITGQTGADIPVGEIIAWILAAGETLPAAAIPGPQASPSRQISPKARRLAKEAGIDIDTVQGSGPGGEILASDVQALADPPPTGPQGAAGAAGAARISSVGRLMAERTTQSWTTVPHFFLQREIDATALNAARAALGPAVEQATGVKLTHTDLLIALVARTLVTHPLVNAGWAGEGIRLNPEINVSLAMAVEDGVVAAVLANADKTPLREIAQQRRELTERARAGRLRLTDLSGGTFTISNLGMFHVDSFNAIITPPQAAILAVGRIADRVVPVPGGIGVRPMVTLTLSSDHRVLDGAKAASFLHDLAEAMREPEKWVQQDGKR